MLPMRTGHGLTKRGGKDGWNAWKDASTPNLHVNWDALLTARRIQIQILLHLLKISLPGPCPPDTESTGSPPKKRKGRKHEPKVIVPSVEERLESFMDKLSTWQLLGTLDVTVSERSTLRTSNRPVKEDRDWMQIFCEDLVETQCVEFLLKLQPSGHLHI
jgi:hypothetical protein